MRVLLRAPLLTISGYGVHSRQIFDFLYKKDNIDLTVECLSWGRTSWVVNNDYFNGKAGDIMKCSKPFDKKNKFDLSVQVQLPDEWDTSLAKRNIGISAVVETDRCNTAWIENCNKMDEVIVPSRFTKTVLKRSGELTTPVHVVPEWYNHSLLNKSEISKKLANDERYNFNTKFNILVMGQLTSINTDDDRKNLINTLKWLLESFKDNEEVGIVLKTNVGKSTASDKSLTEAGISQILKEVRKGDYPKVHLIHGNMSEVEVAALYNHRSIKMFVSATRGEGYGLPLIDAAVTGLPIVVTGWSGHMEFLNENLVKLVDYNLEKIKPSRVDGRIFIEGSKWAEPIKSSFCRKILEVYENYEASKSNAKKLQKIVTENFHKSKIEKKYNEVMFGD